MGGFGRYVLLGTVSHPYKFKLLMSLWEGLEDVLLGTISHPHKFKVLILWLIDHWWVFSQNLISYDNATNITFMLTTYYT